MKSKLKNTNKSDKNSSMQTDNHKKQITLDLEEYQDILRRLERLEQAQNIKNNNINFDFHNLHGLALKAPLNPNPRLKTDDDLWKDDV